MRSLSASGHAAAEELVEPLAALGLSAIYSSPYRRSIETVEPLATYLDLPIHEVEDLRERTLGSISDTPFEEAVATTFADFDFLFPGGESSRDAQQRAVRAIEHMMEAHPNDRVAIATHGNLMALYLNALFGEVGFEFWCSLTFPDVFQIFPVTPANWKFERVARGAV